MLAKVLLNRGERLPLKAAITSSETLYDFQREAIERAFQCRVFDYYAAAERVVFAVECDQHSGHHLCEEYGITEIVDDEHRPLPAGTEGIMVGTSLHNLGMPMIRYLHQRPDGAQDAGLRLRPAPAADGGRDDQGRRPAAAAATAASSRRRCSPIRSSRSTAIEASQLVQTDLDRLLVR